jgi:predicted transcriptional regulator
LEGTMKRSISRTEFMVINELYRMETATVHELLDAFAKRKDWKYTTILTIVQRAFYKKLLKRTREGRMHIYRPAYTKDKFYMMFFEHIFGKKIVPEDKKTIIAMLK